MKRRRKGEEEEELIKLSREFVKNRLSAAGVSYVVTSKSKCRRNLWILVLLVTATFMAYMTYKVIKEYLQYPKRVIKEGVIRSSLEFPAITLCTLNPISWRFLEVTSMASIPKLRQFLETVERKREQPEEKYNCTLNPMCRWSFFREKCICVPSPCETEFCESRKDGKCNCSNLMCFSNHSSLEDACGSVMNNGESFCQCKSDDLNKPSGSGMPEETSEALEKLTDKELKDLITLIGKSHLHDLTDIEDDLMLSSSDIYTYGTRYQDFIISCSYEGYRCSKENFTLYFHAKYGKCYIFNFVGVSTVKAKKALRTYNFGQNSGLNVVMSINNSDNAALLTRELGVRVVIHDPRELPSISEYGFNIEIHDYTSAEVSRRVTKKLGPPWGLCVKDGSHLPFDFTYLRYDEMVCRKVCRRAYIREICNCTKRSFLMGKVVTGVFGTSTKFCSSRNITESTCVQEVLGRIDGKSGERIDCKCHPACKEKKYVSKVYTSAINTDFFDMVKGLRTLKTDGKTFNSFRLSSKTAMLGLKVYYNTLEVETLEEVPSYSWESLVANVGGNLGFFMGLSVVTFVEVCEFLWDILLSIFGKNKIRDIASATSDDQDSFPQTLGMSTPCRCTTLERKITDVEFKLREMSELSRRDYIKGERVLISPGRKYSRRYYRLRSSSMGRSRGIRRRTVSTNTERSLTLPPQNSFLQDFLMENSQMIIENRPSQKTDHYHY